jgi:hypothetical protein
LGRPTLGVVVGVGRVEVMVVVAVVGRIVEGVGRSVVVTVACDSRVHDVCVHFVMVVLFDVVLITDVVVVKECTVVVGVFVGVDDCCPQETSHIADTSAAEASVTLNRAAMRRTGMLPTILCVLR